MSVQIASHEFRGIRGRPSLQPSAQGSLLPPIIAIAATILVCSHDNPNDVTGFGLISVTPWPVYVIGAVLSVGFMLELRASASRSLVLAVYVGAMALLLHGVASLLEPVPRFPVAYVHAGITQVIINHGHPIPSLDSRFSWPGFFTAAAAVVGIAHLGSAMPLIRWTPLAFNLSYCLPIFVIARTLLSSSRRAWLVVWLFLLTNWVGQDYFSPQGLAYFMFLGVLAVVVTVFARGGWSWGEGWFGRVYRRLFVVVPGRAWDLSAWQELGLLGALTSTVIALSMEHQLTPVVLAVDVFVLAVCGVTSARYFSLICIVSAIGWISYGAIGFWSGHLSLLFGSGGSSAVQSNVSGHFTGSGVHELVLYERVAFTLAVWLVAAAGVLHGLWRRRRANLTPVLLALAPFPILLAQAYGGEATLRLYFFTLPFMLILAVAEFPRVVRRMPQAKMLALAGVSIVLVPAFLIACYGNERFEQATPSDIAAAKYLYATAKPGSELLVVVGNFFGGYTKFALYRYAEADSRDTSFSQITPTRLLGDMGSNATGGYLMITPAQKYYAIMTYGFPSDWVSQLRGRLAGNSHFTLIYSHADSYIYAVRLSGSVKVSQGGGV